MIQIEVERDIAAPLPDVFARVIDIPGYASWLHVMIGDPCLQALATITGLMAIKLA